MTQGRTGVAVFQHEWTGARMSLGTTSTELKQQTEKQVTHLLVVRAAATLAASAVCFCLLREPKKKGKGPSVCCERLSGGSLRYLSSSMSMHTAVEKRMHATLLKSDSFSAYVQRLMSYIHLTSGTHSVSMSRL